MFERFYVTDKGKLLEARLHAQDELNYTRFAIGDGSMSQGQSIEEMTALVNRIKYLPIDSAETKDSHAVVTGAFSNQGMSSFYFREIGLFATDPIDGEILYAYANAAENADLIPASTTTPVSFTFGMDIAFSNTEDVTITYSDDLAFATHIEVAQAIAEALLNYNLKTYTAPSQFGLTGSGYKPFDIVEGLPAASMFVGSPNVSGLADVPTEGDFINEWRYKGPVIVLKYSNARNIVINFYSLQSDGTRQRFAIARAYSNDSDSVNDAMTPWTIVDPDGITTALNGKKGLQSAVSDPTASGTALAFIAGITQNAQGVISPLKKTVQSASQSQAGVMSAADKAKLDGIAAGAQVNSITGVKGNAENSYRTGNVNLTPANVGAKATQSAVSDPTASGTALAFIAGITQNAQGVISPTKKNLAIDNAPTSGSSNPVKSGGVKSALDGKVSKSGDTMTGNLFNSGGFYSDSKFHVKDSDVDATAQSLPSAVSRDAFMVTEANDTTVGIFRVIQKTDSEIQTQIGTRRQMGNDTVFNTVQLGIAADGTQTVNVTNRKPWKKELQCDTITAILSITGSVNPLTGIAETVTTTKTVAGVTSDMTVDRVEISDPALVKGPITITTSANSVKFTGKVSGNITIRVKLSNNTDVYGT